MPDELPPVPSADSFNVNQERVDKAETAGEMTFEENTDGDLDGGKGDTDKPKAKKPKKQATSPGSVIKAGFLLKGSPPKKK